ncbi:helix-turn-helix domain-containing protein [Leifsonia sp. LS-T14]|uniref:helix-turn-helix domain-containing protein n=1 Tax=unclassified Leifsonia TaxID=2663824 RepID=UPI0035A714B2
MADMTVPQLARLLNVGDRYARTLVEDGTLTARQLPSGEWLIDSDSVARFMIRRKPAGRGLDTDTAWAILYELSGIRASGLLPPATYARVRKRIRTMTPEAIAVAVSGRTTTQHYRSANAAKAQADLIPTARAASDIIATELLADTRRVAGYVPAGTTVAEYARTHFMVPDTAGHDTLYENTAPGGLTEALPAVVAADLAVSTDTRERSAGLRALGALRNDWRLSPNR